MAAREASSCHSSERTPNSPFWLIVRRAVTDAFDRRENGAREQIAIGVILDYLYIPDFQLEDHGTIIDTVCISPFSTHVATGARDATIRVIIRVYSMATRRKVRQLTGHKHWITCLTYTPDSKYLISGSRDCDIKIWWAGEKAKNYELGTITAGETFVEKERIHRVAHMGPVTCFAVTSDSKVLASGSDDMSIKLWSIPGGALIRTISWHRHHITSVAFSEGSMLASASKDSTLRIWKIEEIAATAEKKQARQNNYQSNDSGPRPINATTIKLWNTQTGGSNDKHDYKTGSDVSTQRATQMIRSEVCFDSAPSGGGHDAASVPERIEVVAAACSDGIVKIWSFRKESSLLHNATPVEGAHKDEDDEGSDVEEGVEDDPSHDNDDSNSDDEEDSEEEEDRKRGEVSPSMSSHHAAICEETKMKLEFEIDAAEGRKINEKMNQKIPINSSSGVFPTVVFAAVVHYGPVFSSDAGGNAKANEDSMTSVAMQTTARRIAVGTCRYSAREKSNMGSVSLWEWSPDNSAELRGIVYTRPARKARGCAVPRRVRVSPFGRLAACTAGPGACMQVEVWETSFAQCPRALGSTHIARACVRADRRTAEARCRTVSFICVVNLMTHCAREICSLD
eukprot:jgi/Bigna1/79900/fgenesh1_pg.66_\